MRVYKKSGGDSILVNPHTPIPTTLLVGYVIYKIELINRKQTSNKQGTRPFLIHDVTPNLTSQTRRVTAIPKLRLRTPLNLFEIILDECSLLFIFVHGSRNSEADKFHLG